MSAASLYHVLNPRPAIFYGTLVLSISSYLVTALEFAQQEGSGMSTTTEADGGLSNGDVIAIATIFSLLFASLLGTVVTIVLFYLKHRYDQANNTRTAMDGGITNTKRERTAMDGGTTNTQRERTAIDGTGDNKILVKERDLKYLMKFLNNHAWRWRDIGTALDFLEGELKAIEHANKLGGAHEYLRELLRLWVNKPEEHPNEPTIDSLIAALQSNGVNLGAVADTIRAHRMLIPSQQPI